MNFFSLFGNKKKEETLSPLKVIQNMKETLQMLEKREEFLEKCINKFKTEAKITLKTNKQKTLLLLKKAKMNEKQLLSIYGQKENLELQICALEQGINNKNIIISMKHGKDAIEKMTKTMDVDSIEDLMDSIADGMEMSGEIAGVMARPLGEVYDDDDLLSELMEEETELVLQSVPVKKEETTEEKELDELKNLILT
jgi:charged multivesicular body protein 4